MSWLVTAIVVFVGFSLVGLLAILGARAQKLARELDTAERKIEALQNQARTLVAAVNAADEENKKKIGWLDHQEQELNWLKAELERRPKITRKTYKILTLGMKATGKTSLTLKWSNPLIDLGTMEAPRSSATSAR